VSERKPRGKPFVCGFDPRRHILTRSERQKGYFYAVIASKIPSRMRAHLRSKIRNYYQNRPPRRNVAAGHYVY